MIGGKTKNPYKGCTAIKAQGRQIDRQTDRQTDKEGGERNRERGRDRDRARKKTEGMVRERDK